MSTNTFLDNIDVDDYLSDDLPYYKTKINNFSSDEEGKIIPFSGGISFHQDLKSQALNLIITEKEIPIIDFLKLCFPLFFRRCLPATS